MRGSQDDAAAKAAVAALLAAASAHTKCFWEESIAEQSDLQALRRSCTRTRNALRARLPKEYANLEISILEDGILRASQNASQARAQ